MTIAETALKWIRTEESDGAKKSKEFAHCFLCEFIYA